MKGTSRPWILAAVLAAACGTSGCAMWGQQDAADFRAHVDRAGGGQHAPPPASYYVVYRPDRGKPEQIERSLSGQIHLQDALTQVGAAKKFRRIELELWRQLPSGGIHKIPLEYDRASERVAAEFDYALLPGDRIVVSEDPSTIIDDMLQSALGPLGEKFSRRARDKSAVREKYKIEG